MPCYIQLMRADIRLSEELDIEIGRTLVELDTQRISTMIRDNVVLVTGAGGSIGAELCRQIAPFDPAMLYLLDQSESALYDIRSTGGNSLQWVGRFKLEDPEDIQKATAQYAKELVNAMMEKSISTR